jgi:hypothetical protein
MTILLEDIWNIQNLSDYKVHFARWNGDTQSLEVFVRDKREWQEWQEYRPGRNDFNRPYIFSLMQFYHEPDIWLFIEKASCNGKGLFCQAGPTLQCKPLCVCVRCSTPAPVRVKRYKHKG